MYYTLPECANFTPRKVDLVCTNSYDFQSTDRVIHSTMQTRDTALDYNYVKYVTDYTEIRCAVNVLTAFVVGITKTTR